MDHLPCGNKKNNFDLLYRTNFFPFQISGENIQEMLIDQIVHYTIHGSLFDIVVMLTLSQLSFKLSLLTSYYKFNF